MIRLLLLLVSALGPTTCGGSAVQEVRGTVGGAVRLKCNISASLPVKGVYFQKKNLSGSYEILVNGFYTSSVEGFLLNEYRNRTRVNRTERSLDLWNLKVSDEGHYKCFFMPQDTLKDYDTIFHLTITANYSVPTVTVQECSDRGEGALSCELGCSSSGGYPLTKMNWTVSGGSNEAHLQEGSNKSMADKHSGVWNISQTIRLNCTQPTNVSCSVGGAVSPPLSICIHSPPEPMFKVIIASVMLFVFIFILLSVLIRWRPCRRPQRSVEDRTVEHQELKPADPSQTEPEL
ncbi:hypothetical protein MHYP_G00205590 [Metynnis hypsauchen]